MRHLLLLALTLTLPAWAFNPFGQAIYSVDVVPSSTAVPQHFSGTNGKVFDGLSGYSHLEGFNTCSTGMVLNCNFSSAVPADGDSGNIYIPSYSTFAFDGPSIAARCYLRGYSGVSSEACEVSLMLW